MQAFPNAVSCQVLNDGKSLFFRRIVDRTANLILSFSGFRML